MMLLPPGATLQLEFITQEQETILLHKLEEEKWYGALGRQVIHYGSMYRYFASEPERVIDPIPEWIPKIQDNDYFNQVIINKYLPGQGIAPHVDHTKQFGHTIATLSLGSIYTMDLIDYNGKKIALPLPRRSLLVLKEDARYRWKHGIAKRLKDPNTKFERGTRISITYRHDNFIDQKKDVEPLIKKPRIEQQTEN